MSVFGYAEVTKCTPANNKYRLELYDKELKETHKIIVPISFNIGARFYWEWSERTGLTTYKAI